MAVDIFSWISGKEVLIFLGASSLLKYAIFYKWHQQIPASSTFVGRVARLVIYPVKSMAGVEVMSAVCRSDGISSANMHDRNWIVANEKNDFVSAREEPKMMQVQPSFHGQYMHLDAPQQKTLKVPTDLTSEIGKVQNIRLRNATIKGIDCGDTAAAWLQSFLGKPGVRLYFCPAGFNCRHVNQGVSRWEKNAKPDDKVIYHDKFPFMMVSDASLQDLNNRLSRQVGMDSFRPNIITTGCKAFVEDFWEDINIGDGKFSNMSACNRCLMTTVIPKEGVKDKSQEPLKTLRSYRLMVPELGESPCFGRQLVLDREATIHVGDPIYARISDAFVA